MSPLIDSGYAWRRLLASVIISTMGGIGMWALAVAMPAVQIDLGVTRADISFAYSMNMMGFVAGGVLLGRLVDRRGIVFTSTLSARNSLICPAIFFAVSTSGCASRNAMKATASRSAAPSAFRGPVSGGSFAMSA